MGFSLHVESGPLDQDHVLHLRIRLSGSETRRLFMAGDVMLSWPPGEILPSLGADQVVASTGPTVAPIARTNMFVSEAARLPGGLRIRYRRRDHVECAAASLRQQLLAAGILEEL